jgi:16S rRNA (guanine(1405)-N(7))-methyltransferase
MISEKQINQVLEAVKQNKKYSSISEVIIKQEILNFFKKNQKSVVFLEKPKSEKFKNIIKQIRSKLHNVYGSFQTEGKNNRDDYLKGLQGINDYKTFDNILATSISAKERLKDYAHLYKEIFAITGKPKRIVDLGSGLNPVSFPYMGINKCFYYAYDIDQEDIDFLNRFFVLIKRYSQLEGKASIINLKDNKLDIPNSDICFMFKLLDVIEEKGHKVSEKLIRSVNSKYIVVSFPIKTVSGKKMNHPYRGWIERMLSRIKMPYKKILTQNEVFYCIDKSKSLS